MDMMLQAVLTDISLGSHTVRGVVAVMTLVAGWGGWKGIKAVTPMVLPVVDDVWMGSYRRNAARVEQHQRSEMFHADIEARTEMYEIVRATAQSTAANAIAVAALVEAGAVSTSLQAKNHLELVDRISQATEGLTDAMGTLNGELQYIKGRVDTMGKQ